jgi:hypothetical protein
LGDRVKGSILLRKFPFLQNPDTCCDHLGLFSIRKEKKESCITDCYLDVKRIKAPKVDQDDDICPEVPEHFGDHPE